MSAAASEVKQAAAQAAEPPEIESQTDSHESRIGYDPTSKVPLAVALVWICALIGLGAYAIVWFLPELALWGAP